MLSNDLSHLELWSDLWSVNAATTQFLDTATNRAATS